MSVSHLGILNNGAVINPNQTITPLITNLNEIITGSSNELKIYDKNNNLIADFKNGGGSEMFSTIITPDNVLNIERKDGITPLAVINTDGLNVHSVNNINSLVTDSSNELKIYASNGSVLADFKIGGETLNTSSIVTGPSDTLTIYENDGKTQILEVDQKGIFTPSVSGISEINLTNTNDLKINSNTGGVLFEIDGVKTVVDTLQITEGANNGYILTSDSSGNATWSPPPAPSGITSITGTANEIFVETVNNNVTLSLPQPIAVSSSPTFNNILANGTLTANLQKTGNIAAVSNNLNITSENGLTNYCSINNNVLNANNISNANYYGKSGTGQMKITATDGKTQLATFVDGGTVNIYGSLVANKIKLTEGANNGYILTSDSSGNATWSQASSSGVSSITGTNNQIIASSSTGAVTLSTPQNIGTNSNVIFNSIKTGQPSNMPVPWPLSFYSEGNNPIFYNANISVLNDQSNMFFRCINTHVEVWFNIRIINNTGGTIGPPGSATPYISLQLPPQFYNFRAVNFICPVFTWILYNSAVDGNNVYLGTLVPVDIDTVNIQVNLLYNVVQCTNGSTMKSQTIKYEYDLV